MKDLRVVKSSMLSRADDSFISPILKRFRYSNKGFVGKNIINSKYNTVLVCEDMMCATVCFSDGVVRKVPKCILKLKGYIMSLYEKDFPVSSFSICETSPGYIDVDLVNSKNHEVYSYGYRIVDGKAIYRDCGFETSAVLPRDEQPFPSIDSDEPNGEVLSNLLQEVLVYCNKFSTPIKRLCVFSEKIGSHSDDCLFGVGSSKNYWGILIENAEDMYKGVYFNVDADEYDVCFLVLG